ncbi:LBL_2463 family protein, partial [Leptospira ellisii]
PFPSETRNQIEYLCCSYQDEKELIELSRNFVKDQYSKLGYIGYNTDFDRLFDFDGYSRYFIAINKNREILATSRVVWRGPHQLPIEYAFRSDTNEKIEFEKGNIAEMNSFAAVSMSAGFRVLSLSTDFLLEKDFDATYGLFDTEKPAMGKLYNRIGAIKSTAHNYSIYFPDYGKLFHGKIIPTNWEIQVSDKAKIIAKK